MVAWLYYAFNEICFDLNLQVEYSIEADDFWTVGYRDDKRLVIRLKYWNEERRRLYHRNYLLRAVIREAARALSDSSRLPLVELERLLLDTAIKLGHYAPGLDVES